MFDPATGTLTLLAAPTANSHAATKLYVDTGDAARLALAGGTMTGALVLAGAPTVNLHAATKQYVDGLIAAAVAKAGGTMTGLLLLSGDPAAALGAATKQYVDTAVGGSGFESAEQAVVGGANTSVAHGLGGVPRFFSVVLRCKTADLGYAVGDEVALANNNNSGSGGSGGTTPWANATTVGLSSNAVFTIMKADASVAANITMANWKMVFRAWR